MDKKPNLLKRFWSFIVRAVHENGDVNERRNMLQAQRGSHGAPRRY